MKKETAEVSSNRNWVKTYLSTSGVQLFDVEGYRIDGDEVAILMDRRYVEDVRGYTEEQAYEDFFADSLPNSLKAKKRLAELADCAYHVLLYDNKYVRFYEVGEESFNDELGLLNYREFGMWLDDATNKKGVDKKFINSGDLPYLDRKMREYGTVWPSNLDGLWYSNDDVRALFEFQTTNVVHPRDHSNNDHFTEDKWRWNALDKLRTRVDRPLGIVVWSPNRQWPQIRLKRVGEVDYDAGKLRYDYDQIVTKRTLIETMEEVF